MTVDDEIKALFETADKAVQEAQATIEIIKTSSAELKRKLLQSGDGAKPERVLFCSPVTGQSEGSNPYGGLWYDATGFAKIYGTLGHYHTGADLNLGGYKDSGAKVYAAADGVIVFAGQVKDWQGSVLVIKHTLEDGKNIWTRYAHIVYDVALKVGDVVRRGQVIGFIDDYLPVGEKGDHLHFDIAVIDLGANPGDWPGKDFDRLLKSYIMPKTWLSERSK